MKTKYVIAIIVILCGVSFRVQGDGFYDALAKLDQSIINARTSMDADKELNNGNWYSARTMYIKMMKSEDLFLNRMQYTIIYSLLSWNCNDKYEAMNAIKFVADNFHSRYGKNAAVIALQIYELMRTNKLPSKLTSEQIWTVVYNAISVARAVDNNQHNQRMLIMDREIQRIKQKRIYR